MLDINLDLSTAARRMMARTVVNFAEYERERISERTKAGLAAKKQRGEQHRSSARGWRRLAVVRRIVLDRNAGLSSRPSIAPCLGGRGYPQLAWPRTWQASTVRRIYQSATPATENGGGDTSTRTPTCRLLFCGRVGTVTT